MEEIYSVHCKKRRMLEFTDANFQGELAQTGERSLCMREAPGSIPGFSNIGLG